MFLQVVIRSARARVGDFATNLKQSPESVSRTMASNVLAPTSIAKNRAILCFDVLSKDMSNSPSGAAPRFLFPPDAFFAEIQDLAFPVLGPPGNANGATMEDEEV